MSPSDHVDDRIEVLGASQNNLKDVDACIPAGSLTIVTGLSGSGKSSLAFDTLYAEGQRRYVESMSAYARQFLERMNKPSVREIRGIRPTIAIRQKNTTRNPRSTVGTVTEIYDFLRLLYARVGTIMCRNCGREVRKDTVDEVVEQLLDSDPGTRILISFPFKGSLLDIRSEDTDRIDLQDLLENLLKQGFFRWIPAQPGVDPIRSLPQEKPESEQQLSKSHVLVDRIVLKEGVRERLTDSIEMSYAEGNGVVDVTILNGGEGRSPKTLRFTERFECQHCNIPYRSPEPRLFSFNNPYGACPTCQGFGNTMSVDRDLVIPDTRKSLAEEAIEPFSKPRYRRFQKKLLEYAERNKIPQDIPYEELSREARRKVWQGDDGYPGVAGFFQYLSRKKYKMHVRIFISRYRGYSLCPDCDGERLRQEARDVYLGGLRISQLTTLPVSELRRFFSELELSSGEQQVARKLLQEVRRRLDFLIQVGLDYLTLNRLTSTLSGGEMQRIHLSASLGSSLVGTLYVLDEPSIGLHPRDQDRLIHILQGLRDLGNTILVVEHERNIITSADWVIDMGPGAGELGGEIVHQGDVASLLRNPDSLTGKYLKGQLDIPIPIYRRTRSQRSLRVEGARQHNLKNLSFDIPMGVLVCVTGVSGSGKSTLVHDVIYAGIKKLRGEWKGPVGRFDQIEGWEYLTDVIMVDQSPIGRTPRSNPVTYIKAFDEIRKLFAGLRDAQARNLTQAHFSFNVPGGRCETCQGSGTITVEMQFLADVELECEDCRGARYTKRVLEVLYKGKSIQDVLQMTVQEAITFFKSPPSLLRKLQVLQSVGLGYLRLGQSATTLSGGEAQRIKLASYLSRKTAGHPLFIFDEPTTGLHFDDIGKLLRAFDKLISQGATVLVIEHNLDIIKSADWVLDLGPEGGQRGGEVIFQGRPEDALLCQKSYTGTFLREYLESDPAS